MAANGAPFGRRVGWPSAVRPTSRPCASPSSSAPLAPPLPGARPEAMFDGRHCGRGVLAKADGAEPRRFAVVSEGERAGEGLRLVQTIRFEDGETRERVWTLRPEGEGDQRYTGTLTEASGPVRAAVSGPTLRLTYPLAELPLGRMTQHLTVQPDGTVTNTGTVTLAGFPVRRLTESIAPMGEEGCAAP
ncbi:DUF3833 family protein [Parvularcula oceani]|uniref:DUF3833 family protein n=1 Tax=Parvularcula oceani TaxID=1247963 RepID=UPI002351DBA5|nr:DUF3833 family protein [Parvularcula oceani]